MGGSAILSATGGASGNPVVFSVDSTTGAGVCTVSGPDGTTVNYAVAGNCVIDADQASNSEYAAAPQLTAPVPVGLNSQAITWTPPAAGVAGTSVTLSATGGASGNPVVFSVDSTTGAGVCNVSGPDGTTVNYAVAGNCVIDADQAGNSAYAATPQLTAHVPVGNVPTTNHTVSFRALHNASSGLPVSFTTTTPTVCTSGGTNGATITMLATGTCTVQANQAGNATYNPAPAVNRRLRYLASCVSIAAPCRSSPSPVRSRRAIAHTRAI